MDNKLTIFNLAETLAEKTGVDLVQTEKFIEALVELISEGIKKDQLVKAKGIGTFKVIQVKERESIHVNTGERIVIPAHYKLSFVPEKLLKDQINKPFSFFETVEATALPAELEALALEDADDEEDVDLQDALAGSAISGAVVYNQPPIPPHIIKETNEALAASVAPDAIEEPIALEGEKEPLKYASAAVARGSVIQQSDKNAEEVNEDVAKEPTSQDDASLSLTERLEQTLLTQEGESLLDDEHWEVNTPETSGLYTAEEPLVSDKEAYGLEEDHALSNLKWIGGDDDSKEKPVDNNVATQPGGHAVPPVSPARKKSRSNTPLYFVLVALLAILGGCMVYYFFYQKRGLDNSMYQSRVKGDTFALPGDTTKEDAVEQEKPGALIEEEDTIAHVETVAKKPEKPKKAPKAEAPKKTTEPAKKTNNTDRAVIAKVKIVPGHRLTALADQYYGDKIFWVYIYEYNKKKIGSNPNNIRPGMVIEIPSKATYGIDAKDSKSIEKAKSQQAKILSKR